MRWLGWICLLCCVGGCVEDDAVSPPADAAQLGGWLDAGHHLQWSETPLRPGTDTPLFRRIYFNDALSGSLSRGDTSHPVGAAAVRELYDPDGSTLVGWAVMIKVDDTGAPTDWFFYEHYEPDEPQTPPLVGERGAPGCVGCHSHATDMIMPLEAL